MILPEKLYIEALKQMLKTHRKLTSEMVMDGFADYFYQKTVTPTDKKLMDLAFNGELNQDKLDIFLKTFDIECVGGEKALLLAYVMKEHPELKFNDYTLPRLRGLLKFFRFKNLELLAQYTKICGALNKQGIIPMILKGGAMKYLRPEFPRVMGDIDILVRTEEEYQLAQKIVKDMGFELEDNVHSVDLHLPGSQEGILDIHRYIEMDSDYEKSIVTDFFSRAKKQKVFGVETYVPCAEDMVFISLVNMVRNLREKTSLKGILYNLFDLKYFKNQGLDWKVVCKNVTDTHTEPQFFIASKFIGKIVPDFVPNLLKEDKKFKKTIKSYCNKDIFYCLYVEPVKFVCKGLHLKNEIKDWGRLKYYCKVKGQHFFTKRIAKSPVLRDAVLKIVNWG